MAGMRHSKAMKNVGGAESAESQSLEAWQKPEDPWKIVGSSFILRVNKGKLSNANVDMLNQQQQQRVCREQVLRWAIRTKHFSIKQLVSFWAAQDAR